MEYSKNKKKPEISGKININNNNNNNLNNLEHNNDSYDFIHIYL
jgi:hypothetical protein